MAARRNACIVLLALLVPLYASTVVIQKNGTTWELLKDGQPYFVKGAGGGAYPEKLVAAGGNSIRTWSPDKGTLDKAQSLGLTVCLGISGNNFAQAQQSVQAYKSHPALLMWGLGNEMESSTSDQVALWKGVDSIARMIKQLDGQHPCITVVADISNSKVQSIMQNAPNLDALGINTYAGMSSLKTRVTQSGWTKPFFVTEFVPVGWWECAKSSWKVPLEQTSTEKESTYVANYQKCIQGNAQCLGGYAFLWGNKQEKTHTWFGMFLPSSDGGNAVGTVDGMQFVWTGTYPANQCPRIKAGKMKVGRLSAFNKGTDSIFRPSTKLLCTVDADDPNGDSLIITWDLRVDVSDNTATGGAYEPPSVPIAGAVLSATGNSATIQLPADVKKYRIFCYVKDPKGSAATVNYPINVDPNAPVLDVPVRSIKPGTPTLLVRGPGKEMPGAIAVVLTSETDLSLKVFSLKGELLSTIDRSRKPAGRYTYAWDARAYGKGVYYVKLAANGGTVTEKVTIRE
jgi:hypothetical protein